MNPLETISAFDRYLVSLGLRLDATIIGGAALNLLGVVSRPTKDCDVLEPQLPEAVLDAARAFAAEMRSKGTVLRDDWLNNGPTSLVSQLPPGWRDHLQVIFRGSAVVLRCLGRDDLLRSKLFALCDRGIDMADCLALAPTADEIRMLLPWLEHQDANPDWPAHVRETMMDLAGRLGYAL